MHEILDHLGSDAVVLDLGSGGGSFRADGYEFRCVRVDLLRPQKAPARFVQADAW